MTRRVARDGHRRYPATLAVGVALVGLGLGAATQLVYSFFGTSWMADRQVNRELEAFDARLSPLPTTIARLHTDLKAYPPPDVDVHGRQPWGALVVPMWQGGAGAYGETTDGRIPIKEGTTDAVLDSGSAGHYLGTAAPGKVGNFSLAGHRRTHGDSFLRLDELRPGDALVVETADAWFVYEMSTSAVVTPTEWQVVAAVPGDPSRRPTERSITLTTCTSLTQGAWGNDHRLIVHGTLVGWADRAAGIPPQLVPAT